MLVQEYLVRQRETIDPRRLRVPRGRNVVLIVPAGREIAMKSVEDDQVLADALGKTKLAVVDGGRKPDRPRTLRAVYHRGRRRRKLRQQPIVCTVSAAVVPRVHRHAR